MIHRVVFYGLILLAAAVLPYLSSEWSKASRTPSGDSASQTNLAIDSRSAEGAVKRVASASLPARPQPGEVPLVELGQAIRFDVAPAMLFERWPRVVTGLPEGELQGYRVPLVTGTREDDVAGSLTYYFNRQQICRRITLQGSVGDPRKLSTYVVSQFGLLRQNSADPGLVLYQTRWNGKPVSELKIRAAPVVKSTTPHARYQVELALNSWGRK